MHPALDLAWRCTDALLAVLLAPSCAACKRLLDSPASGAVCLACWSAIHQMTPPVCEACGDPLPSWRSFSHSQGVCPRCRRLSHAVDRGRAIGAYEGALRDIIHAFKYQGRRSLARPLAALMRAHGATILSGADLLVPVPLHRRRQRIRGFNQAEDLAAHLGLPVEQALTRTRATASQTELPAAQRHRNVRGAFALKSSQRVAIKGKCVVLVDDVSTTGATLEECARTLKAAGAREVRALTAARAVWQRPT